MIAEPTIGPFPQEPPFGSAEAIRQAAVTIRNLSRRPVLRNWRQRSPVDRAGAYEQLGRLDARNGRERRAELEVSPYERDYEIGYLDGLETLRLRQQRKASARREAARERWVAAGRKEGA
jgi:hypothetical protein